MKPVIAAAEGKDNSIWDITKRDSDLLYLFRIQHHNKLLCRASSEWMRVVDCYPDLALAEYPMQLATIVEKALVSIFASTITNWGSVVPTSEISQDITKTGDNYWELDGEFYLLRSQYNEEAQQNRSKVKSPLTSLRALIPDKVPQDHIIYKCDPDLCLSSGRREQYYKHIKEGEGIIKIFNKALSIMISRDIAQKSNQLLVLVDWNIWSCQ